MRRIKLIKSTFMNERETKKKLCGFIKDSKMLTMGNECRKFEESFSRKQGRKYSVYVSNGSCANLLLIQTLMNIGRLKRGDEVFVSGLTWPTNIMPIIQLGLVPVLLGIELVSLNASSAMLKEQYLSHPNARALFLTNALGFCSDIENIREFCKEKNIIFLEDNCESLGSEYKGKKLGNFGLASTFSFFVGHHISTIEGGMICTDDLQLYENAKSSRSHGWTRNNSETFRQQKRAEHGINDFYDIYAFYDLAYNFRPTEINGFLGNQQIKYWDVIVRKREGNFKRFYDVTVRNPDIVKLDLKGLNVISNFGFPVVFKDKKNFEYYKVLFEENNVEIRPIISGDMRSQPFFKKHVLGDYICENLKFIHENGFYFGNNPEMNVEELGRICKLLESRNE